MSIIARSICITVGDWGAKTCPLYGIERCPLFRGCFTITVKRGSTVNIESKNRKNRDGAMRNRNCSQVIILTYPVFKL